LRALFGGKSESWIYSLADPFWVDCFALISARSQQRVKSFIRFLGLVLCLSGWAVAALCLHVIRIPDPANAQQSKLIVVPKNRLNVDDTYVDARAWTMADVKTHPLLVLRLMKLGKADDLKFLADPKNNKDIETQLTDALSDSADGGNVNSSTTSRTSIRPAGFSH
jgi:hypothetical protein